MLQYVQKVTGVGETQKRSKGPSDDPIDIMGHIG